MYSFTDEEFIAQVKKSKGWGEPTTELLDMMEELIMDEARLTAGDCQDKVALVESSISDFESNGLLQGLVNNAQLDVDDVVENFRSSICCTFNHYKRKTE